MGLTEIVGFAVLTASCTFTAPRVDSKYLLEVEDLRPKGVVFRTQETAYTLFRILEDGSRKECWRLILPEKYLRHWISPEGRVWVVTGSAGANSRQPRVWVRDKEANTIAAWTDFEIAHRSGVDIRTPAGQTHISIADSDWISSRIGEVMQIPFEGGGKSRLGIILLNNGQVVDFCRYAPSGSLGVLESVVFDSDGFILSRKPLLNSNKRYMVWKASIRGEGRIRNWIEVDSAAHRNRQVVEQEIEIEHDPIRPSVLPGENVVWFEESQGATTIRFFTKDLALIGEVDFRKLPEVRHVASNLRLDLDSFRILDSGIWMMPDHIEMRSAQASESFRAQSTNGYVFRFDLKIGQTEGGLLTRVYANELAQPKEPEYLHSKIDSETVIKSPNGRFRMRIRRFTHLNRKTETRLTLIAFAESESGEKREVELWSRALGTPPSSSIVVTDSGKTLYLHCGDIPGTSRELAVFQAFGPDGSVCAGFDLIANGYFKSSIDAIREFASDKLRIAFDGPLGELCFQGVRIPVWAQEVIEVPFKDGRKIMFETLPNTFDLRPFGRLVRREAK